MREDTGCECLRDTGGPRSARVPSCAGARAAEPRLTPAVLLLLLALAGTVRAGAGQADDPRFDSLARKGIDEVYNLQFEEAQKTFAALTAMRPHHPAGPFFPAMITWWRILIDIDNTQYDDEFYAAARPRRRRCAIRCSTGTRTM